MLDWAPNVPLDVDTTHLLKFRWGYLPYKERWHLFNSLLLKFRSVDCPSISESSKQHQVYLADDVFKNICM